MSEWKQGAVERRDARHVHDEPGRTPPSRRKNTRRWCKGKVGRAHTPAWGRATPFVMPSTGVNTRHNDRVFRCTRCGKEMGQWFDDRWGLFRENAPQPALGSTEPLPKRRRR